LSANGMDQRKFHHPMESPKAMDVEGQEVVLDEAPIFRLVLGHDAEIGVTKPSSQPTRSASPHVSRAFRPDDIHGDLQPGCAIDTAMTAKVVLLIGVQGDDLVAEESCRFRSRMGDQRLLPGEFELERVVQESPQLKSDLFGLLPWPTEAEQEVIRIPDIPQASEVGVVGITRGHSLCLSA
jgi:hypothetical protein